MWLWWMEDYVVCYKIMEVFLVFVCLYFMYDSVVNVWGKSLNWIKYVFIYFGLRVNFNEVCSLFLINVKN